ncbi:MAG TPA: hypothetical protein VK569_06685, partial [Bacteroidota bacterium]|nr:hypothetical protein [Bacteroidota bacterium]
MHRPVALIVLLCLMRASGLSQSDTASYRAALAVQSDSARITALVHFLDQFPRSAFRGGAYNVLFGLYVRRGNEPQALGTAAQYLQTMAPESRMNPYNQIAYALAEAGLGLDSALAYATRSEEMARGEGSGALGAIQDTRAFVLYRKGDVAAAENLQMEAMRGHEDDPEYVGHLALYQEGNGKRKLALLTISRAMYMGAGRDMETRFFQWLSLEERDPGRREALKDSIVMRTVHSFIDTLREGQAVAAKSTAAAFMARMSVDLSRAEKFALDAVGSLVKSSPAEETVAFRQNLAMVTAARGKYRDALLALQSIENLVSPWSTDFWMALGGAYQRTGQPEKAVGAYMNGLTVIAPAELRDTLEVVYRKVHGSTEGLDAEVERVKQ